MPQDVDSIIDLAADLARRFEGLRLEPYHDPVGYPTVGYGTLLSRKAWAPLDQWPAVTEEEAEGLLRKHLMKALASVVRLCPVPLEDGQAAALVDFCYNLGPGSLEMSTLRRCVNRGDHDRAGEEFGKWVYAGRPPVKLPGLIRRRKAETILYLGDDQ